MPRMLSDRQRRIRDARLRIDLASAAREPSPDLATALGQAPARMAAQVQAERQAAREVTRG